MEAAFVAHRVEATARADRVTQSVFTLAAVTAAVVGALLSGGADYHGFGQAFVSSLG